jgi:hypothetical protein
LNDDIADVVFQVISTPECLALLHSLTSVFAPKNIFWNVKIFKFKILLALFGRSGEIYQAFFYIL